MGSPSEWGEVFMLPSAMKSCYIPSVMNHRLFRSTLLSLAFALPAFALAPGDAVPLEGIAQAEFIQGEAPTEWAKDEVYIIECWATWCGPCIAAIPHVDELFDTYAKDGLHVLGMNVWEDGKDKVAKFVEGKGEGMSYPVAYVGKGGAFEESWLKAAGVRGIPHAFVVKNGNLLFTAHPASITEETIKAVLAGGDQEATAIQELVEAKAAEEAIGAKMRAFGQAKTTKDVAAMQKIYDEMKALSPDSRYLSGMNVDIAVAEGDWAKVSSALTAIEDRTDAASNARGLAFRLDGSEEEVPASLREKLLSLLAAGTQPHPYDGPVTARLHWALGQKDLARESAQKAIGADKRLPVEVVEAFAATFDTEEPQTLLDFQKSLSAAMQKKAQEAKATKEAEAAE